MITLLLAATLLGFGERPVSDLQLVPTSANPRLASNGRGFVGAWTDDRGNEQFLFRATIDGAGNLVDSRAIAKAPDDVVRAVVTDGDRYLVAYSDAQKGVLLDEHGDFIREIAIPKCDAIASNGLGYAVGSGKSVQLLDREGAPAGQPVPVNEWIQAIAPSGTGYLIVSYDYRHVFARTLSRAGVLSPAKDAGYFPTWGGDVPVPFAIAAAGNGSDALIAVNAAGHNYIVPIHDGNVGAQKEILPDAGNCNIGVLAAGSEFIVISWISSSTMLLHVSRDGSVVSRPVTIEHETGSLAWNGWRLLLAGRTTARLHSTSAMFPATSDAQPLAPYAVEQTTPRIATDGDSALVMWRERWAGFRLERIAADGTHADGPGLLIDLTDATDLGAVAWSGTEWLVAYPSTDGVRLRTMNREGVLSPGTLIPSLTQVSGVRLSSDGTGHFAVIWETANPLPLVRVSIDGAFPVDLTHYVNARPDVTWDAGALRMVWMNYEYRAPDAPWMPRTPVAVGITFATMKRSGIVAIDGVTQTDSDQQPRVAGNFSMFVQDGVKVHRGGDEIATLSQGAPQAFAVDDDGHALLVSPGGTALLIGAAEPQSLTVAPADAASPDVVWTRNGWMMVYTRIVDEAPYFHVPRVFVKTIDVSPARRRP